MAQDVLRYVQDNYDRSVTLTVDQIECVNISTATFRLQIIGLEGNKTLQKIQNDIIISAQKLNIGIGILKLCEQNCTGHSTASDPASENGKDGVADRDQNNRSDKTIALVVTVIVAVFLLIILTFGLMVTNYKRYAHVCVHCTHYKFCISS